MELVVVAHLDVRPRRHGSQVPQETAHGTTTVWPTRTCCTPLPTARTCATHSWPIANGPLNGTRPQMQPTTGSMARTAMPACSRRDTGRWIGTVSPSQRAAMNGRTIASPGSLRIGASRSRHASLPLRMNASSRTWTILLGSAASEAAQLWSVARADSAGSTVAAQLPRSFSASSEREPGSAV